MGDNPCFYYSTLFLFCVLEVVYYCSKLSLSQFSVLLCQVKSLIVRFILDLDYCAETDFFAVTNLGKILCRYLRKLCQFTCVILRYVRNFHSIWAFSSEQVWCHFKIRLYELFCFDRLCLLFRIACFDMFDGFFDSINFQQLCAMSRSVKNDCVTSEHVNF